ncbi:MAG: hypothetical protein ACI8UO_000894 [Verrucomicrobiales bacterium]|jgi:hypothetical protein
MTFQQLLIPAFLTLAFASLGSAETWSTDGDSDRSEAGNNVVYLQRSIQSKSGKTAKLHLVFFNSKDCKLEVVDLGGSTPKYSSHVEALRAHSCIAGVNGGFFEPDFSPIGLMIAGGESVGKFTTSGFLTSGVITSNSEGIDLIRRSAYRDRADTTALLQGGPYLVESAAPVRGLDDTNARRRTAVLTDWRGNWAVASTSSLTLAELAEVLSSPDVISEWKVNRALNLDGGTSCGFYVDRNEADGADIALAPWKRVRNLLGIAPR